MRPERVDWIEGHNLATSDPELAAKIMSATAKLSARVQKPVYHASIAWHHDEQPTRDEMQTIAKRTLGLMGLAEHQALVVGHGDTNHPHLHLMINRVHPESGNAWRTSHDYLRLDRAMKLLAEEHGFAYVPSHRFNIGEGTADLQTNGPTKRSYRKALREGRSPGMQMTRAESRRVGQELREQLDLAQSWEDVDAAVAMQGYRLEAKSQGLVVAGEKTYEKFSALGASMKLLEGKFGETFGSYRRRGQQLVDGIDILRALAGMGMAERKEIAAAVQDAVRSRNDEPRSLSQLIADAVRLSFQRSEQGR